MQVPSSGDSNSHLCDRASRPRVQMENSPHRLCLHECLHSNLHLHKTFQPAMIDHRTGYQFSSTPLRTSDFGRKKMMQPWPTRAACRSVDWQVSTAWPPGGHNEQEMNPTNLRGISGPKTRPKSLRNDQMCLFGKPRCGNNLRFFTVWMDTSMGNPLVDPSLAPSNAGIHPRHQS